MINDPERDTRSRRPVVVAGMAAAVAAVAAAAIWLVARGDDQPDAEPAATSAPVPSPATSAPDGTATSTDPGATPGATSVPAPHSSAATTTEPSPTPPPGTGVPSVTDASAVPGPTTDAPEPDPGPPPSDPPEVPLPPLPTIGSTEGETCESVKVGLREYRERAASSPLSELITLQFGLDEFEAVADFVAEGHDWGNRIVEQLVVVRRDWSTAYSADQEGDREVADERFRAAIDALDAAIAVPCPD